jgi:hypothetical protein
MGLARLKGRCAASLPTSFMDLLASKRIKSSMNRETKKKPENINCSQAYSSGRRDLSRSDPFGKPATISPYIYILYPSLWRLEEMFSPYGFRTRTVLFNINNLPRTVRFSPSNSSLIMLFQSTIEI